MTAADLMVRNTISFTRDVISRRSDLNFDAGAIGSAWLESSERINQLVGLITDGDLHVRCVINQQIDGLFNGKRSDDSRSSDLPNNLAATPFR